MTQKRKILWVLIDILLVNLALLLSFYLRLEDRLSELDLYVNTWLATAVMASLFIPVTFHFFGLYRYIWRYASVGELLAIALASTIGVVLVIGSVILISLITTLSPDMELFRRLPHIVSVLFWFAVIFLTGGVRFAQRAGDWLHVRLGDNQVGRILIIGAGDAGAMALRELKNREYQDGVPIGFVDDDPAKLGLTVQGVPVLGTRRDIPHLTREYKADRIIIAIPSASGSEVREIADICQATGASLKIMPGVYDILSGKLTVSAIREVGVEDLLGREPVNLNVEEVAGYLKDQVVLVTGAGGSIGSELCRQILTFSPRLLVLGGHGENSIFNIEQELREFPVRAEIFEIRDEVKVLRIMRQYRPDVVFHAAAHKHVPLMENNPEEALLNNVLGTSNLTRAAAEVGVRTFVMISTDKAVNPRSFMGASKRLGEMIVQDMDARAQTKFTAVRFGNVLGSRGSVVPIFKQQIMNGGPVTVTHPEMTRYFMTIPEACQLVIQSGAMAEGGEIFILDMGSPMKIVDLARSLIQLSGFEPDKDISIVFTGVRPGEKLYEELLTAEEGAAATRHSRIFVGQRGDLDHALLQELTEVVRTRGALLEREEVEALVRRLLPAFHLAED